MTFFRLQHYLNKKKTKTLIGLKKKRLTLEKKTHVDNCGFGFWVEISTNYFFILYMADKAFWKKIKAATYVF